MAKQRSKDWNDDPKAYREFWCRVLKSGVDLYKAGAPEGMVFIFPHSPQTDCFAWICLALGYPVEDYRQEVVNRGQIQKSAHRKKKRLSRV